MKTIFKLSSVIIIIALLILSFPILTWAIRSMLTGDYGAVWQNDIFRPNNPLKQIYPAEVLVVFVVAIAVGILWLIKTVKKN